MAMKNAPTDRIEGASAAPRRVRFGAFSILLLITATATAILASLLAAEASVRLDVTATREHALSQRTKRLLGSLSAPHELVIVADLASIDPRARRSISDVLIEFERASDMLRVSEVDVVSPEDRVAYASLLDRIADLSRERIDRQTNLLEESIADARTRADTMTTLSDSRLALRRALPAQDARRPALESQAAVARTFGGRLERAADEAASLLEQRIAGSSTPPLDRVKGAISPLLATIADELQILVDALAPLPAALEREQASDAAATAAENAATVAERAQSNAGVAGDRIARLERPDVLRIARVIERGPAAVIVSPDGATAVRFDSLFPSTEVIDRTGGAPADLRFVGEELLATAIASLDDRANPIVVFVHAQPGRLLDAAGQPRTPEVEALLGRLIDRLALRGIDAVDWPTGESPTPPNLTELDPDASRPRVWITLAETIAGAEAATRLADLVDALESLDEAGEPILLSAPPSTLPAVGEADPLTEWLTRHGVLVDSGRPLLERRASPAGPVVFPGQRLSPSGGDHPVAASVRGLPTILPWPVPIDADPPEGVRIATLLSVPDSESTWAESQWISFRATPAAQRSLLKNPPAPSPQRDDVEGPWGVGVAIQRPGLAGETPHRLIVIGSNGWFFDEFAEQSRRVEGRTARVFPGNGELFESAVYWLAGMDEYIAPSPRSQDVPRIADLSSGALGAIRWALIGGLPVSVLAIGVFVRLLRG